MSFVVLVMRLGDGKVLHLLAADVHHVAEELFAHREAEARRRLGREIPAAHGQHGACERAAKHFHADGQDIRRLLPDVLMSVVRSVM